MKKLFQSCYSICLLKISIRWLLLSIVTFKIFSFWGIHFLLNIHASNNIFELCVYDTLICYIFSLQNNGHNKSSYTYHHTHNQFFWQELLCSIIYSFQIGGSSIVNYRKHTLQSLDCFLSTFSFVVYFFFYFYDSRSMVCKFLVDFFYIDYYAAFYKILIILPRVF